MTESPLQGVDLEAAALELFEQMATPVRRPRPRVAAAFRQYGEDALVETAGGGVQAWRIGEGPAVLLVHGWQDDNSLWGPMIDKFLEMRRPVVALDLPGHGFSPARFASVPIAADALLDVARELGPIEAVVGHSFGCPSSMMAITKGLDVARAVMIASPLHMGAGRGRSYRPGPGEFEDEDDAPANARQLAMEQAPPEVQKRAQELYAERLGGPRGAFDALAAARAMKIPALFVCSMDDRATPPENTRELCDAWPGADLMLIDGAGHRFVCQDDDVVERVVYFVEAMA